MITQRLRDMLWLRIRSIFARSRVERELEKELRFHLDQQIEEELAAGLSPEAARLAALRTMGGVTQICEECRDMRGTNFLENLKQDLHYAVRTLAKNRGFTAVMVMTLALSIGATSAIVSGSTVFC